MQKTSKKTNIFSQMFKNGYDQYREEFNRNPLLRSLLLECVHRSWHSEELNSKTGLDQGEFFLSKQEYGKFGLKESQANQISRKLDRLQELGFIKKIDNKKGNKNATVYGFLPNDLILPTWMAVNKTRNEVKEIGNTTAINKENNKEEDIERDKSSLIKSIKKIAEETDQPFNTHDGEYYIDLLLSDEFYFDVLRKFDTKNTHKRWEVIAKVYKMASINKKDPFWKGKISDFKGLYSNFSKIYTLFIQ